MNTIRFFALAIMAQLTFLFSAQAQQASVPTLNGFQLEDLALPLEEMFIGGPEREKIKALDTPAFLNAADNTLLSGKDFVIGIFFNGEARAYPARILNHHEVVNDRFGNVPVAVTYSPLSGAAIAYRAEVNGEAQTLGVSGLVYNNNPLFFDQKTQSLWAQMLGQAVAGKASGHFMEQVPATWTTWDNWQAQHPNTVLLSHYTGADVDYTSNPYAEYETKRGINYPINKVNKLMPLKEKVVGVEVNGMFRAYPMFVLELENKPLIADTFNGMELLIRYDKETKTAMVTNLKGEVFPSVNSYWYSWYAFHSDTDVYMLNHKNGKQAGDIMVTTAAIQR